MRNKGLWMGVFMAIVAVVPFLGGCAVTNDMSYANAEQYIAGGGSVSGAVTEIEIDWVDGSVEVVYGDVENVTFSETAQTELSKEYTLHYWLENTTLHIKFAQAKKLAVINRYPEKHLKVVLPNAVALQKLDVEGVDTNVKLDNLEIGNVEVETVDGAVNAYLVGSTREISVETVEGDITLNANEITHFDIETVGANVYVESVIAPKTGSFESVGGSLTLALYEVDGFTFELEGLGGNFRSDFETSREGKNHVYGNGGCRYEAETVGGNVSIVKKTTK